MLLNLLIFLGAIGGTELITILALILLVIILRLFCLAKSTVTVTTA